MLRNSIQNACGGFRECVEEDRSGVVVVEVGEPVVTTEGEEVVVAFGLVTLQAARHGISFGPY